MVLLHEHSHSTQNVISYRHDAACPGSCHKKVLDGAVALSTGTTKSKQGVFEAIFTEMASRYDKQISSMEIHLNDVVSDGEMFNTGTTARYAKMLGQETNLPVYSTDEAKKTAPRGSRNHLFRLDYGRKSKGL